MALLESFEEDQKTVQRYGAYRKAYGIFRRENPECVIYGETYKGKQYYYTTPYGCSLEKLQLLNKTKAAEGRVLSALYRKDMKAIWDYLEKGIMVKADPRLHEAMNPKTTSEDVEKLIDDLYELRKSSLEADGEYGLGNLVFKEIRGMGYLDELKDMKKYLEGKELSLTESDYIDGDFDTSDEEK